MRPNIQPCLHFMWFFDFWYIAMFVNHFHLFLVWQFFWIQSRLLWNGNRFKRFWAKLASVFILFNSQWLSCVLPNLTWRGLVRLTIGSFSFILLPSRGQAAKHSGKWPLHRILISLFPISISICQLFLFSCRLCVRVWFLGYLNFGVHSTLFYNAG